MAQIIKTADLPPSDMKGDYPIEHMRGDEVIFRAGGKGHWYIFWGGGSDINEGPYPSLKAALKARSTQRREDKLEAETRA